MRIEAARNHQTNITMGEGMNKLNGSGSMFPANQVIRAFQISAAKQTLFNIEGRGEIPEAHRVQRGKTSCRVWEVDQLPFIGEKMGFLRKPESPKVVSVFSLKGGTSKSSLCFQVARSFALHNIRTLVIGLDAQETITQTLAKGANKNLSEDTTGIYHALTENLDLSSVIQDTDIPTLKFIPETIELSVLDMWLKTQLRKEYIIRERLVGPLVASGKFDLILFDCNPSWSEMVTGALSASDVLLSPLGADINSLKAANIFVNLLADFQDDMKHTFKNLRIIPTMVETNKMSQTILARYRVDYNELCTAAYIRRSVVVQESNARGLSLMEVANGTAVFQDYVQVLKEINLLLLDEPRALYAAPGFVPQLASV
jgi:chromosome partitioning protein